MQIWLGAAALDNTVPTCSFQFFGSRTIFLGYLGFLAQHLWVHMDTGFSPLYSQSFSDNGTP